MFCGCRWYTMRLSEAASSRQTSSVLSVEALSVISNSRSAWSWASTDRTTPTTSSPALQPGSPSHIRVPELAIRNLLLLARLAVRAPSGKPTPRYAYQHCRERDGNHRRDAYWPQNIEGC